MQIKDCKMDKLNPPKTQWRNAFPRLKKDLDKGSHKFTRPGRVNGVGVVWHACHTCNKVRNGKYMDGKAGMIAFTRAARVNAITCPQKHENMAFTSFTRAARVNGEGAGIATLNRAGWQWGGRTEIPVGNPMPHGGEYCSMPKTHKRYVKNNHLRNLRALGA